jgi:hypothetical protein
MRRFEDMSPDEQSLESLALLQIIEHGKRQVERGEVYPIEEVIKAVRRRIAESR